MGSRELSCIVEMLRRGALSSSDVVAAVRKSQAERTRIGKLALEAGMLTVKQVFAIVTKQGKTKRPFGETAVSLGFMTQDDVDCLMAIQAAEYALSFEILPAFEIAVEPPPPPPLRELPTGATASVSPTPAALPRPSQAPGPS
jgi:hypothetical protein